VDRSYRGGCPRPGERMREHIRTVPRHVAILNTGPQSRLLHMASAFSASRFVIPAKLQIRRSRPCCIATEAGNDSRISEDDDGPDVTTRRFFLATVYFSFQEPPLRKQFRTVKKALAETEEHFVPTHVPMSKRPSNPCRSPQPVSTLKSSPLPNPTKL